MHIWQTRYLTAIPYPIITYHVSRLGEADSHPARSTAFHVDVQESIVARVGINSDVNVT